jgi:cytochrome c oxidase subunit 2
VIYREASAYWIPRLRGGRQRGCGAGSRAALRLLLHVLDVGEGDPLGPLAGIAEIELVLGHEHRVTIDVVGQKWSWTFNYKAADNPAVGSDVWEAGTINKTPDLYLPVGKLVQFNLISPDVIHSFWVPSFYEKLDVIPGRHNSLQLRPTTEGVFPGRCAELCGTYHSAMLFNLHVVSETDYNAYLNSLEAKGQTGEAKGPAHANSPAKSGSEEGAR